MDPGRQRAGRRQASGSNENIGQVETVQLDYVRTQKFKNLLTRLRDIFNDESLSDTLKALTLKLMIHMHNTTKIFYVSLKTI